MNQRRLSPVLAIFFAASAPAFGAVSAGLINDFEDGTLQGWTGGAAPTNIPSGGPAGAADNFLQIGGGTNFATINMGPDFAGAFDPSLTSYQVDLMRPATDPDALDMRLVLFGPFTVNRWTSTVAQSIPNDGIWRTYLFSTLEADLTQVQGSDSYSTLVANVGGVMFRHDPDPPEPGGIPASGTLGIDNITAVPEPSLVAWLVLPALLFGSRRRR
ncbi:hypothetical protein [Haloferula sp.]|uniref:hypothetical protein n=1 Tax=Haloferula sp. TaxID=2497595 RepID=UPI00329EE950